VAWQWLSAINGNNENELAKMWLAKMAAGVSNIENMANESGQAAANHHGVSKTMRS